MSVDQGSDSDRKMPRYHFDRHTAEYRERFTDITEEMQSKCPLAWSDTYNGHWVAADNRAVFELARSADVSADHDVNGERRGYQGISIPKMMEVSIRGGLLEMDDPEHKIYRGALNPYLSPAAIKRWEPFIDDVVRACLDEKIETGHIDFVDDLANIVPAVVTLAMLGIPLQKWEMYNEPAHASVYTAPDSPDAPRVLELYMAMGMDLFANLAEIRDKPRPGIINALAGLSVNGEPAPDMELLGMLNLLIGGGFDTTTALTAHALEWLSENPDEREVLSRDRDDLLDPATEEFLRFYTPAPGDGRTIAADLELDGKQLKEGDRLWLSWAMANRDPEIFHDPNDIVLDRTGNRHFSFGIGMHRCIGSNLARTVFKSMLCAVLDRMPDYRCVPENTVHYETIGVIQGMRYLPATFTPGPRVGAGLDETLENLQRICVEQELARPVTERKEQARIHV
ncbi:cytochrome P450 [Nocardia sp. 348MFTsu5.1]|uniref:cytochrome P450 n=1 Tax=Nocardia sp. 348MFTsu5.1 TaxID=1172185 RepID=UPI000373C2C4|nr:cytochrome P450 [Nocardia sp. 348MFTsu5.1]